jgi:hypothetical protein
MRPSRFALYGSLIILLLLAVGVTAAHAQTGYSLTWWTVDGGGVVGAGSPGPYTLSGTAGQPDAGVLNDGGYVLTGGFWVGGAAAAPWHTIYLPLVLR